MARPRLAVDGGTPPPAPDDREPVGPDPADAAVVAPPPPPEDAIGWTRETVASLVAIPFLALHLFAARRGPDDAWLPSDSELDVMAAPLHNIAERSMRLRPLARFGDGVAFLTATGTYAVAESRRIARWRAEHGPDEPPPLPPDAELGGLFTGERVAGGEPPPAGPGLPGGVRAWRPPTIPQDR